jgi:hypothetical protein
MSIDEEAITAAAEKLMEACTDRATNICMAKTIAFTPSR